MVKGAAGGGKRFGPGENAKCAELSIRTLREEIDLFRSREPCAIPLKMNVSERKLLKKRAQIIKEKIDVYERK